MLVINETLVLVLETFRGEHVILNIAQKQTKFSNLSFCLQEFQRDLGQWRKEPGAGKKKPKYSFKTVEELKAHGKLSNKNMSQPAGELAQVKVK